MRGRVRHLVVIVLGAVLVAGAAGAVAQGLPSKPPKPLVTSKGRTVVAASGSYCWPSGGAVACVDFEGEPFSKRRLPLRGRCRISLDMGLPATSVRLKLSDGFHTRGLGKAEPVDGGGRFWRARVKGHVGAGSNLLILAEYQQGDALFGVRLRPPQDSSC